MRVTTITHDTIVGPKRLPITIAALNRLVNSERANLYAGRQMWARLLDAQRDQSFGHSPRSHGFLRASGEVRALALVLADIYGMSPTFWQMEVQEALNTPCGDYADHTTTDADKETI